jgi:AcrR family transcriptional regulator
MTSETASPSPSPSLASPNVEEARAAILDAAEALLRRHGPDKLAVTDVARALKMSHANVYRFFENKAALIDTLVRRWLGRLEGPLGKIAAEDGPAPERLKRWALTLHRQKREKVSLEPEMFAAFDKAADQAGNAVRAHLDALEGQLAAIIADGKAQGVWPAPAATAAADVFAAISAFSHPGIVQSSGAADRSEQLTRVVDLLDMGLRMGA